MNHVGVPRDYSSFTTNPMGSKGTHMGFNGIVKGSVEISMDCIGTLYEVRRISLRFLKNHQGVLRMSSEPDWNMKGNHRGESYLQANVNLVE